jgi:hypothetical protein
MILHERIQDREDLMLYWLVDNSLWLVVLLALANVALAYLWWTRRRWEWLLALGGVLVLIVLLLLAPRVIRTDRRQLEQNTYAIANGVTTNKPAEVVQHLSRDFQYLGVKKENAEKKIADAIKNFGLQQVHVFNFEIEHLDRAQKTGRVVFRVRVSSSHADQDLFYLVRASYVLEDDQWRLKDFKLFNPIVNTDQEIVIQPLP